MVWKRRKTAMVLCLAVMCALFGTLETAALQEAPGTFGEAASQEAPGTAEGDSEIRMTRKLTAREMEGFEKPREDYWDQNGISYQLSSWDLKTIPCHRETCRLEKEIIYAGVEGAEGLPESIEAQEEVSGHSASGSLNLRRMKVLKEEWQNGFCAPVVFEVYGAQEYHAGSLIIQGEEILEGSLREGEQLLAIMGLSPKAYQIQSVEWMGESYEDENGRICRQALASGQKLLRDYQVVYEGEVQWQEPESYELEMIYRRTEPMLAQKEAVVLEESQKELTFAEGLEKEGLWYWVRSGFAITVGIGLLGIAIGLILLLAMWYRQERRERRRRRISQIIDGNR